MESPDFAAFLTAMEDIVLKNDPTENVRMLLNTAIQRQDDLREAEVRHLHELADVRVEHIAKLMTAEAARLDAIRSVDVGAVAAAAAVAETRAQTLANQVAASAEAMRTSLASALEPIQKDIQDLRRAQYEAQGSRTQVVETRASGSFTWQTISVFIAAFMAVAAVVLAMTR